MTQTLGASAPPRRDALVLDVLLAVLVGLLYYGAIMFTTLESFAATRVSDVWLAAGIGIGALYVSDTRRWPAFLVCMAVASVLAFAQQGHAWDWLWVPVAIGLGVNAVTAALLKAWRPAGEAFTRPAVALQFFGIGVVGSSLMAALLGASALLVLGGQSFMGSFAVWFITNLTGTAIVLPLVVAWAGFRARRSGGMAVGTLAPGALTAVLALAAALFVFDGTTAERFSGSVGATLTYLPLLFLALTALSWGLTGATLVNLVVALIAMLSTAFGHGPFAAVEGFAGEALLEVQGYVFASSLLTVLICALAASQRRAREDAAQLLTSHRTVLAGLRMRLYELDPFTGTITWDSHETGEPLELAGWLARVAAEERPRVAARFDRLMRGKALPVDTKVRYDVQRAGGVDALHDEAQVLADDNGRVYRVVGVVQRVERVA